MSQQIKYRFYATLLDAFQGYLDTEKNYNTFYSNPDSEKFVTYDAYEAKVLKELIDRINRVPFESEAADKGTAFNEIVDALIAGTNSEKCPFTIDNKVGYIFTTYKNRNFAFKKALCEEFADYYKGAMSQVLVSAVLDTKYGKVELYGYIDELMPFSVHDIKTTKYYQAFKFQNHWQHYVYPYCLSQLGSETKFFEYNITNFEDTFTERYEYVPERDVPILRNHCEALIEFLMTYRHLITDKKIFNLE